MTHPSLPLTPPEKRPSQTTQTPVKTEYPTPGDAKPTVPVPLNADAVICMATRVLSGLSHSDRERALVALVIVMETEADCAGVPVLQLRAMVDALTR